MPSIEQIVQNHVAEVIAERQARGYDDSTFHTRIAVREEDITTRFEEELAKLEAGQGGTTTLHPGRYTVTRQLNFDPSKGPTVIHLDGVEINAPHAGRFLKAESSTGGGGTKPFLKVVGGTIVGSSAGAGGFLVDDAQGNRIHETVIRGYTNGVGIEVFNGTSWSEINKFIGIRSTCKTALKFSPAEAAPGTASFARTRVFDLMASGGLPGEPQIWLKGGFYGSTLVDLGGNVASGAEYIRISAGNYNGTLIGNIDFETTDGGGGGVPMFTADNVGTSIMPTFVGARHTSSNNTIHNTDPAKRLRFGPLIVGTVEYDDLLTTPGTTSTGVRVWSEAGVLRRRAAGSAVNFA